MANDPDEETSKLGETLSRGAAFQPKAGKDEKGELSEVALEEVLTNLFCARLTGTLTIEKSSDGPPAEIVVWKGDLLAASWGKQAGDEAVIGLLQRKTGAFCFTEEL